MMQHITVIGLGDMGTVLARVLLEAGNQVTIWNRTRSKAAALEAQGTIFQENLVDAIQASSMIMVCVHDYVASDSLLQRPEIEQALFGKILIQLSTGTPKQAREAEVWAQAHGIRYLDGAIAATPSQMGQPSSPLFVSGAQSAYQESEAVLKQFAGGTTYLGEKVSAAASFDLAFLSNLFGSLLGFYHAATILEADGMNVEDFGNAMANIAPIFGELLRKSGQSIQRNDFANPESTLKICAESMYLLLQQARESGTSDAFPRYATALFQRALDAGLGLEQASALIKVMR